jgi:hypothetical protein
VWKVIKYLIVLAVFVYALCAVERAGDLKEENDMLRNDLCIECYQYGSDDSFVDGYRNGYQDCALEFYEEDTAFAVEDEC